MMIVSSYLSGLRLVLAALAVMALLVAPAAAERIELEASSVEHCDASFGDPATSGDPHEHTGHDHHAHSCGSCHVHMLRSQDACNVSRPLPEIKRHSALTAEPTPSAPFELLRPPRI